MVICSLNIQNPIWLGGQNRLLKMGCRFWNLPIFFFLLCCAVVPSYLGPGPRKTSCPTKALECLAVQCTHQWSLRVIPGSNPSRSTASWPIWPNSVFQRVSAKFRIRASRKSEQWLVEIRIIQRTETPLKPNLAPKQANKKGHRHCCIHVHTCQHKNIFVTCMWHSHINTACCPSAGGPSSPIAPSWIPPHPEVVASLLRQERLDDVGKMPMFFDEIHQMGLSEN